MPDTIIRPAFSAVQPGAYGVVDASAMQDSGASIGAPVVAVLGVTLGGQPNTALKFRANGPARNMLRGGAAYDVARFALGAGASRVFVVRVGTPTQSSLALSGATGTPITLTSLDWGSWTTAIKAQVSGSVITLTYTDSTGNQFTEKWDLTTYNGGSPTIQNFADAINGKLLSFPKSQLVSAAVGTGTLPLATLAATPLAGGTDALTPSAGDWTNALKVLETENVSIIVPATSDATVHAQVMAHCDNLSVPLTRRERTAMVGGALGEAVTAVITRRQNLPDKRVGLCAPGFYDYDAQGNKTLYDPFYLAGKIAGLRAALPDVATALTHQAVPIVDVETRYSTVQGSDLDQLLLAGVTPIAPEPGFGFWVVDDLTGYTGADRVFLDMCKVRASDFVLAYVRNALEVRFVGGKGLAGQSDAIAKTATQALKDLQSAQIIRGYQAATVTSPTSGTYLVTLPTMLIDTTKYIYLTEQLQPASTVSTDVGVTSADALS